MKYLKLFENYSNDVESAQAQLAELDSLRDFAILTADEYNRQSSELLKILTAHNRKVIRKASQAHKMYSDGWYAELAEHPSLSWLVEVKELPEYSELLAAGLHPVSSIVQLGNRTIVFAKDPAYTAGSDYAIGFFSSINVVRRLTADVIRFGRRTKTLDQKVKALDSTLTPVQFFKDGMRWVLENLDLTQRSFPNKKMVSAEANRDIERVKILDLIKKTLSDRGGIDVDSPDFDLLPIDGLNGNMGELRKLASKIKKNAAKPGPLEIPITPWRNYEQETVDLLSRYPNVVWTIYSQFIVPAKNTRNWNVKSSESEFRSVVINHALAADDILRKLEAGGLKSIYNLTYPTDQIDLDDYPGLTVSNEFDSANRRY